MEKNFRAFEKAAREAGAECLESRKPLVVNHFDADGLAAGAIACRAFKESGVVFFEETVSRTGVFKKWSGFREIVFCDLGGVAEKAGRLYPDKKIFVFDHHPPEKPLSDLPENVTAVNPHYHGIDGASECSSSTTTYFSFGTGVELAVAGAVGDTQDFGPGGSLMGLNKKAVLEGARKGLVRIGKDLRLAGRSWKPLDELLSEAITPFLPGLTGDGESAGRFLEENGFGKKMIYNDLQHSEKERLLRALASHSKKGLSKPLAELAGEVYFFPREREKMLGDAIEYAALLNACGREGKGGLGIQVGLGNTSALEEAKKTLVVHEKNLLKGFLFAREKALSAGKFFFIDGRRKIKESVLGSVAGAFLASGLSGSKPVLAFASGPRKTKVSARAGKESGVDLGKALAEAAKTVGGSGGGHAVAAGATIPRGREKEFVAVFSLSLPR